MAQARLREALNAGSGSQKEKGPPVADGILSVTPDTQEALEWRSKRSIIDSAGTSSSYLEDDTGRDCPNRSITVSHGMSSYAYRAHKAMHINSKCANCRAQAIRTVWQVHLED